MKTKMTKAAAHKKAVELIAQLDELALKHEGHGEVALLTDGGRIFSWQKYKLENLTLAIQHNCPLTGFVAVGETKAEGEFVKFWKLPGSEDLFNVLRDKDDQILLMWERFLDPEADEEEEPENIRFVLVERHETSVSWQYPHEQNSADSADGEEELFDDAA